MEYGSNYPLEILSSNQNCVGLKDMPCKQNTYYLVNGRSAIYSVVKKLKDFKHVYLPNYMCEDVYQVFKGKVKHFYKLNHKFEYEHGLDNISGEKFILYVSNYFGLSDEKRVFDLINKMKKKNEIFVIYDITHNMYSVKTNDVVDAYVSSLRKWLYIPDGAILTTDLKIDCSNKTVPTSVIDKFITASYFKSLYINQDSVKFESDLYRSRFIEVEQTICKIQQALKMSKESFVIFGTFQHERMLKRRDNYNLLLKLLKNDRIKPIFTKCPEHAIPFCFPILCKERDNLREFLTKNKVYCAVHWKQDFLRNSKFYNNTAEYILSIPIDQRCNEEDVVEIAGILNAYGRNNV